MPEPTLVGNPAWGTRVQLLMKKTSLGLIEVFCVAAPIASQAQMVAAAYHHHHRHHHHRRDQA
jgi:hypothetical protein